MRFLLFMMFNGLLALVGLQLSHLNDAQVLRAFDQTRSQFHFAADHVVQSAAEAWSEVRMNLGKGRQHSRSSAATPAESKQTDPSR